MPSSFYLSDGGKVDGDANSGCEDDGPNHGEEEVAVEIGDNGQPHISTDHQNFAVGHVDQTEKAENERIPQRNQGIRAPQHQTIEDLLNKNHHVAFVN